MSTSHLLVVDVQQGFINEWTTHLPARIEALQASFDTISVSRFYNPQKSLFRKLTGWDRFSLGSQETHLAFTPREDATIVDTPTYTCIKDAYLDRLRRDAISRVHLCGIATETSVLSCALDLFDAGIEPVVLAHACGSDNGPACHELGLSLLKRLIGNRQIIGS